MTELTEEQRRFLNNKFEFGAFGVESCFDYVSDYGDTENGGAFVEVFVEPCGNITKFGKSLAEVTQWWIDVFKAQPSQMQYAVAGYILEEQSDNLPDSPHAVWGAANV